MKLIHDLIETIARFPGIGPRQAQRIVFYLIRMPAPERQHLIASVAALGKRVRTCPLCARSFEPASAPQKTCSICADPKRIKTTICVVEQETDIDPIEKTGAFRGIYHVIGHDSDLLAKTTPQAIRKLLERIAFIVRQIPPKKREIMEVILATNATVEGDALSLYLEKLMRPLSVRITRLGRGLASGAELEYADQQTIKDAVANRKPLA
ncbi:MAG: recombination mediator RecR [Patescibacteria group bacterium]